MRLMTRAQYRDAIRRDMGLPVASDKGGPVGDPASTHPRPTNDVLNQKLSDAVEMFNLEGGFSVAVNIPVTVAAQTADGPYAVALWTLGAASDMQQGAVYEVRRVAWDDGSGNRLRLQPLSRDSMDRNRREWENTPPATPTGFWIEGNQLYVSPAPAAAGTLYLYAGTGVMDFDSDSDILESFPAALQTGIEYLTVALVASSMPTDPEMDVIAASYMDKAQYYLTKAKAMRQEQNVMLQSRASVGSYRRGGRW